MIHHMNELFAGGYRHSLVLFAVFLRCSSFPGAPARSCDLQHFAFEPVSLVFISCVVCTFNAASYCGRIALSGPG